MHLRKTIATKFFTLSVITLLITIVFNIGNSIPITADELDVGIIQGKIINSTPNGSSAAGLKITLYTFLNGQEINSTDGQTDTLGSFMFQDLSVQPDHTYQIGLFFNKAEYFSEPVGFTDNETTKSIDLFVYDSNTSDEAIRILTGHTVIYITQGSLQIKEYYVFTNDSDRTYVGVGETDDEKNRETLIFSLPDKATEVHLTAGLIERFIKDINNGFADTLPFLPGDKEVAFSYVIDYSSDDYTFSQRINYPTNEFHILIQEGNIKATSDQLNLIESLTIEDNRFMHFTGTNISKGTDLTIHLSGLSKANKSSILDSDNQQYLIWLILLVILAGGFSFVYILLKKRRVRPVTSAKGLDTDRQRLLAEIAQLDDDFEDNKISEEVYRQRRAEKKAQLTALINSSEETNNRQ